MDRGGGYDFCLGLIAKHIRRHLPGSPNVVPCNEPGAGSLKLANELYLALPRDGSVIGMFSDILIIGQILGSPAAKFSPGAGSATLLNLTMVRNLLGAKFKFVSDYEGSAQVRLAMERGEVQGSGSTLWVER